MSRSNSSSSESSWSSEHYFETASVKHVSLQEELNKSRAPLLVQVLQPINEKNYPLFHQRLGAGLMNPPRPGHEHIYAKETNYESVLKDREEDRNADGSPISAPTPA